MRIISLLFGLIVAVLSCKNKPNESPSPERNENQNSEIISLIAAREKAVLDTMVETLIQLPGWEIHIESISKEKFIEHLSESPFPLPYFTRNHRLNEDLNGRASRAQDTLILNFGNGTSRTLIDSPNGYDRFFLQSQRQDLFVLKEIDFEDAYTHLISIQSGDTIKTFSSLGVVAHGTDDQFVIADNVGAMFMEGTELGLYEFNMDQNSLALINQIDTKLAFVMGEVFFIAPLELVYFHALVEKEGIPGFYAKMEFKKTPGTEG